MAGLISTGIWGFICSMLPTGKRDELRTQIKVLESQLVDAENVQL